MKRPYLTALLGGLSISLVSSWVVSWLAELIPSLKPKELQIVSDFFSQGIGPIQIMFFTIVVFLIPPIEEAIFRGSLWSFFEWINRSPKWTWICISVLFAVFHMEPLHVMGLLPLSFFLGWLRLKTGNIRASTVAHMANNTVGCLLMAI
jgi:hypothetical protein